MFMGIGLGLIPQAMTGSSVDALLGGNSLDNYGNAAFLFDVPLSTYRNGTSQVGSFSSLTGLTFTRALAAYALTSAGAWTRFLSGVPRITDRGLLIEGARTNLFLNSLTPSTQTITLSAIGNYTITCFTSGTAAVAAGTATITGAGTATPGTPLVINCTATGTINVTIGGSPFCVNVEAGAFGSSPIETAGSSVTRPADVCSIAVSGISYPATLFAEFERVVDTGAIEAILCMDAGGTADRSLLYVSSGDLLRWLTNSGGVNQADTSVSGAVSVGAATRTAGRTATNSVQVARNGTLGTEDTVAANPGAPTTIRIGTDSAGNPSWGFIKRAAVWNSAFTDAQLQAVST